MDKRYQVFVSSTYEDLQEERQEVMQALLELDCIPSGMELFPAADEDQWTLIRNVIDDCDYYIVIVGGRYGSTDDEGVSFTEKEYRYAIDSGKPIIGFLHRDPEELPSKKTEKLKTKKNKLEKFRMLVQRKMCQFWESPSDLGSKVSRSMTKLIKSHPGVGWVRADQLPSDNVNAELLGLRKKVDDLENQLETAKTQAPKGTEDLAQGKDIFQTFFNYRKRKDEFDFFGEEQISKTNFSWDTLFYTISPLMIDEASETRIESELSSLIESKVGNIIRGKLKNLTIDNFNISSDSFQTIIVQLRALGLITKSVRTRSVKDKNTYWKLTPYGDGIMTRLRAIKKVSNK